MEIPDILPPAVERGASDVHLSAGEPPMLRIHGDIRRLDVAPLTAAEAPAMAFDVLNVARRRKFKENHDVDFSDEVADIARCRVNGSLPRRGESAVFRVIPSTVVTLDD